MVEEFSTVAGAVILEANGVGRWNVFMKRGHRFLGAIELEDADGRYVAAPAGRKPQVCPNLKAAVQVVGSAG